jgi:hypothetical protein
LGRGPQTASPALWSRGSRMTLERSGDSDKENLPAMKRSVMCIKEGREGGIEMSVK